MEQVHEIPIEQLRESPFNPRRTFLAIDELAADIKAIGYVHSPLRVRPILPNPLRDDIVDGYEIVFGHRRFRAAQQAGLTTLPCIVDRMSDADARRLQISENLQRKDVHPIEEAEGFQALIDDGISADQIAADNGKSRSYVYGRLKLLQAVPQVRDACVAGEIGSEVALLVARLRTPKLQEKALAAIKSKYYDLGDGGGRSFRQIRALLNEKFSLELKDAMFDTGSATLLPDAGSCTDCPKRTGNAPEFADVAAQKSDIELEQMSDEDYETYADVAHRERVRHGGADVCTDPDCFEAKKRAHLKLQAGELQAQGKIVIDGAKARQAVSATGEVKGAYIALKDVKSQLKKAAGKLDVITIQDPRTGKLFEAVEREAAKAAGAKIKEAPKNHATNYAEQQRQYEERRRLEAERSKEETDRRFALLEKVRAAIAEQPRDAFDLRLVARVAMAGVTWGDMPTLLQLWEAKTREQLEKRVDALSPDDLTRLMMDCALVRGVKTNNEYERKQKPELLVAAAEHYGIASTPDPAAQAPKAAAARGGKKAKKALAAEAAEDQIDDAGGAGELAEAEA